VQSGCQFEVTEGEAIPSADMLGVRVHPPGAQPGAYLKVADAQSIRAFGNRHCIADVIAVTVCDQDVVSVNLLRLECGSRVAAEEGVDHQAVITHF